MSWTVVLLPVAVVCATAVALASSTAAAAMSSVRPRPAAILEQSVDSFWMSTPRLMHTVRQSWLSGEWR